MPVPIIKDVDHLGPLELAVKAKAQADEYGKVSVVWQSERLEFHCWDTEDEIAAFLLQIYHD